MSEQPQGITDAILAHWGRLEEEDRRIVRIRMAAWAARAVFDAAQPPPPDVRLSSMLPGLVPDITRRAAESESRRTAFEYNLSKGHGTDLGQLFGFPLERADDLGDGVAWEIVSEDVWADPFEAVLERSGARLVVEGDDYLVEG